MTTTAITTLKSTLSPTALKRSTIKSAKVVSVGSIIMRVGTAEKLENPRTMGRLYVGGAMGGFRIRS